MPIDSILLVEDDDLDVISIKRALKKIGLENIVHITFNGIEALKMLRGDEKTPKLEPTPDLIILDLNMPKMNGIEFLIQLRGDAKFKDIKVIIMTETNECKDREIAEKLGISDFIIKPLNSGNQCNSIDNYINSQILKLL